MRLLTAETWLARGLYYIPKYLLSEDRGNAYRFFPVGFFPAEIPTDRGRRGHGR